MALLVEHGKMINYEDLAEIPRPERTKTYEPVSHQAVIQTTKDIAQDVIGMTLLRQDISVSKDGNRMFFALSYQNGSGDYNLCIGGRNSYDKSMAVGFAGGGSVVVCDNMMFTGNVVVMRKHTNKVWDDLSAKITQACMEVSNTYLAVQNDAEEMKRRIVSNKRGHEILGSIYGEKILNLSQFGAANRQWNNEDHPYFSERNFWSLYNGVTFALKKTPPAQIMDKYIKAHEFFVDAMVV